MKPLSSVLNRSAAASAISAQEMFPRMFATNSGCVDEPDQLVEPGLSRSLFLGAWRRNALFRSLLPRTGPGLRLLCASRRRRVLLEVLCGVPGTLWLPARTCWRDKQQEQKHTATNRQWS